MTTVVIADDVPSLRMLVRATIASEHYQVIEAADGHEAWALIQAHRPAVVLLDVHMPGLSGLEVARLVRADPALAGTTLIMLTSQVQEADVAAGRAAGADRYLTKPFSPLELLEAVAGALGHPV